MKFDQSKMLLERAYKVIPSASQTFSKGPTQWPDKGSPNFLTRGAGAWVWDADNNKFLDYLMALGPIILGYNNAVVNDAIVKQLHDGVVFSQMHPLEVEVAELLTDIIPCAEMVRFAKNGTDATSGAIRASRAHTGRNRIAICGYHGWQDWYIGTTTRKIGVPQSVAELSHTFIYNDFDSLSDLFDEFPGEFAAVIMEPMGVEEPTNEFLKKVRKICTVNSTLLIFDEIVSGFRLSLGGAQKIYGVKPDLACYGKAIANGLPLSAIVGPRHIMEIFDDIFFSGTFGGETLSLAACKATISVLQDENGIEKIEIHGAALKSGLETIITELGLNSFVGLLGHPSRSVLYFPNTNENENLLRRTFLMQQCIKRGLLYFCSHIPCLAHGKSELDFSLSVLSAALSEFAKTVEQDNFIEALDGSPVTSIFRKA